MRLANAFGRDYFLKVNENLSGFTVYPRKNYKNLENLWMRRLYKRLRKVLTVNNFSDITEMKSESDAGGGRRPHEAGG